MIEFDGFISGVAEKYFWRRARRLGQGIMLTSMLMFLPLIILAVINNGYWAVLGAYIGMMILMVLLTYIPRSKKERQKSMPQRIYTEEEYIVAIVDGKEDYRLIEEAKCLCDYGAFYVIKFPMGKVSEKFVCQKNLLTKGTLDEFEKLFQDKIVRITGK